jgi:transcriptional regulator with PAS, ATPase and Fis domain
VQQGKFREDVYYRLHVVEIHLPPLRERPGDIPILVEGLLAKITRDLDKEINYVTPTALARLQAWAWPGNVRELENTLTRAVVLAKTDVLDEVLLPLSASGAPERESGDLDALPTLREIERRHIVRVLAHTEWNKRRACAILDISRPTLDRKIEEYGLAKSDTG